ncbi:PBP/GOBP family [Popillia japonica]|uniref:PBP/GOBP family n=1 Tax=Popillia japonica TaxID=7064 RepID=A0AAW1KSF0_POPJA
MIKDAIAHLGTQCLSEESDTAMSDVQDLVDHVRPTTRKALCLITCIHRKAQMQDEHGKLKEDGVFIFVEPLKQEDMDYYEMSKQHFLNCINTVDDDDEACVVGGRFNDCIIIGGKKKDDLKSIIDFDMPTTRAKMCLITCIHEKFGIQDANGKLMKDQTMAFLDILKDDPPYHKLARDHFVHCIETVSDDDEKCTIGANLMQCIVLGGTEKGVF